LSWRLLIEFADCRLSSRVAHAGWVGGSAPRWEHEPAIGSGLRVADLCTKPRNRPDPASITAPGASGRCRGTATPRCEWWFGEGPRPGGANCAVRLGLCAWVGHAAAALTAGLCTRQSDQVDLVHGLVMAARRRWLGGAQGAAGGCGLTRHSATGQAASARSAGTPAPRPVPRPVSTRGKEQRDFLYRCAQRLPVSTRPSRDFRYRQAHRTAGLPVSTRQGGLPVSTRPCGLLYRRAQRPPVSTRPLRGLPVSTGPKGIARTARPCCRPPGSTPTRAGPDVRSSMAGCCTGSGLLAPIAGSSTLSAQQPAIGHAESRPEAGGRRPGAGSRGPAAGRWASNFHGVGGVRGGCCR